nr:uncharacterized protein LOC124819092 [Hydra vulgaris]
MEHEQISSRVNANGTKIQGLFEELLYRPANPEQINVPEHLFDEKNFKLVHREELLVNGGLIVAKIIGGEASLDNDLLSQSQNFSTQDFQDGQIATMEDDKETVIILNIEALYDTSDVQSIVTIPDEEPTKSTSGCNKRRNSDDEKTLNKIAKTEPVRKIKKTNFSSEYLKIANKNLDVQIRSQELRIREVIALERIWDAIENASKAQVDVSKAQVEYYKFLIKK